MRTNLSCCLGLIDNGQHKSTNRLLVPVPHERSHGIMIIDQTCGVCRQMPNVGVMCRTFMVPGLDMGWLLSSSI